MSRIVVENVMEYNGFKIVAQVRKHPEYPVRHAVIAKIMTNDFFDLPHTVEIRREYIFGAHSAHRIMLDMLADFVGKY